MQGKGMPPMRELNGFIKVPRNIIEWRWYSNTNTWRVFFHLLITANYQDAEFESEIIHRGEVATSYQKLGERIGLTPKQARTAIEHLKGSGDVATRRGRQFLVITIVHYEELQAAWADQRAITGQSQGNHEAITGQQIKNNKNNKNEEKKKKSVCPPSLQELRDFVQEEQLPIDTEKFFNHYESIGWRKSGQPITDWKALVRMWAAEDIKKAAAPGSGMNATEREQEESEEKPQMAMIKYNPMSKTEAYEFLKEVQQYREHYTGKSVPDYEIPQLLYQFVSIDDIEELDEEGAYCTTEYCEVPIRSQLEQRYILLLRFAKPWWPLLKYYRGYYGYVTKIKGRILPGLPYLVWLICDKMNNDDLWNDITDEVLEKYIDEAIRCYVYWNETGDSIVNLPEDFFSDNIREWHDGKHHKFIK